MKDGKVIVARTDRKTMEDIRLIIAAGPDETGQLFINPAEKKPKNKNAPSFTAQVGHLIGWVCGAVLGLLAIGSLAAGLWYIGVILLAVAVMIAPPVLPKVPLFKNKHPFTKGLSILLTGFIVLAVGGIFTAPTYVKKAEEVAAAESEAQRQERKDAYAAIKDKVLKDAREAMSKKDFAKVVELTTPYTGLDDEVLDSLHTDANQKVQEKAQAETEERGRKERAAKLIEEVKSYEYFLDNDEAAFKSVKPSDADLDTIRKTTSTFSALAESLNKARQNKDALSASDIAYLKGVEKRLSSFQQRILPGLRLGFRKRASEILWEHDTYVSLSGEGNRIINISAGMFAANANIKATQEQIAEVLTKLRFKEVRYRWYKEADEYTFYKLDTPSDAKLSYFLHGQFQDMANGY